MSKEKGKKAAVKQEDELQLALLSKRKEVLFRCMQMIYDESKNITIDSTRAEKDLFLGKSANIVTLRGDFERVLDEYNALLIGVIDPDADMEYESFIAFEQLFGFIKHARSLCTEKPIAHTVIANTDVSRFEASSSRARLPPIELVSFNGEPAEWPLFYSNFKATVHENIALTDAEKVHYLVGKLYGKARSVFSAITPSAENYELILNALVEKYEDKRMLASSYLNQLLNFRSIQTATAANFERFLDKFCNTVAALHNLKLTDLGDTLLLQIALNKLDAETVRSFELSNQGKVPTYDDLLTFIKKRAKVYSFGHVDPNESNYKPRIPREIKQTTLPSYTYVTTRPAPAMNKKPCLCDNVVVPHLHLYKCPAFESLTPRERYDRVKEKAACINCLGLMHSVSNCTSTGTCWTCNRKHHSSLHFETESQPPATLCTFSTVNAAHNRLSPRRKINYTVLLATAQVIAYDRQGREHILRVLLDSASQSDFITKDACLKLGIPLSSRTQCSVKGFGGSQTFILKSDPINVTIFSRTDRRIKLDLHPLVVNAITDKLPSVPIDTSRLHHLSNISLADESFGTPANVDALIGATLFPHLLSSHQDTSLSSGPSVIRTILGDVLVGEAPIAYPHSNEITCFLTRFNNLDSLVNRFWALEETPFTATTQTPAELECENHYRCTTARNASDGRYIVRLPFSGDVYSLGDSLEIARRRYLNLERKLDASPALREAYNEVIREYVQKQYISIAPSKTCSSDPFYVIPHHGVFRQDKTSTKLRIVLDASCKTNSGISLNDILHSGPNLQGNLFSIIQNFRLYQTAMTADLRQQFLQIIIHENDRRYQRILYRFSNQDQLSVYQFNRVCFGLKSSPFHALRTVQQLVTDRGDDYPLAKSLVLKSLYMDDIVFSIPTPEFGAKAAHELISLFKEANWDLVKWNSNAPSALNDIPLSHKLSTSIEFDKNAQHKILGLHWSIEEDSFLFKISSDFISVVCTKRNILSTVARLWDLMGFVSPTIFYAKVLIKRLWQLDLAWDETPPEEIINTWKQYCQELSELNQLRIPRYLGISSETVITILGFSDASELGYGAVVYAHVSSVVGNSVRLLCAKSRVAPSKPLSIARLELCGAVLLSKLLRTVVDNYSDRFKVNYYAFVDSMVVLHWVKSPPHKWQTFVANRVVQITDNLSPDQFYYVTGTENPADVLSRGILPSKLVSHPLWFSGPSWASLNPSQWPLDGFTFDSRSSIPEEKTVACLAREPTPPYWINDFTSAFSSWSRLLRVTVYICRFAKILPRINSFAVSANELNIAERKLLQAIQHVYFHKEINLVSENKDCAPYLNRLRPFLDSSGLLRVGGRLANSSLAATSAHPIILPRNDHVINLIIDYNHIKYLHAGPELLLSMLRQRYWILAARRIVRQRVHQCNTCFRVRPHPKYPLMADLPSSRTQVVTKAFTHTGCDYAGPIAYTPIRRRGMRSQKAYLCLFTCLTTRAVHLEIATDLSTPCFLAALKRFLSRRGPVQFMYSDNGTNFKGAASYLRELYSFLNGEYKVNLEKELAESRITWKFITPSAPNQGGAWESLIKVVKTHLFRVIGNQILTYEELNTILVQIECILNSRPLSPLSSDASEPTALTPGHFLYTAPLLSLPAPELKDEPRPQDRHALLDKLTQSFWNRWRKEYLSGLQIRQKWNKRETPITPGTVVVLMTPNPPPLAWPLAVVTDVHPSKDGVTRVATVKTAHGTYTRPVTKLCPLPNQ